MTSISETYKKRRTLSEVLRSALSDASACTSGEVLKYLALAVERLDCEIAEIAEDARSEVLNKAVGEFCVSPNHAAPIPFEDCTLERF